MPNQMTIKRKTLTLVIGIIVAIFIAISSILISQQEDKPIESSNETSLNGNFLKETAGFVYIAYSRFIKLY